MKLLEALVEEIERKKPGIVNARMAYFAFGVDEVAFLAQIETEELISLLEKWCEAQRQQLDSEETIH